MLKSLIFFLLMLSAIQIKAQDIKARFNDAYRNFAADPNLKHASIGLLVINNKTGKIITSVNANTGLAPASCQKTIIATTAFDLLGENFTYKTTLGYTGYIEDSVLRGNIIITGSGDPTLGSWRYPSTTEDSVLSEFKDAILREGIRDITGHIFTADDTWQGEIIPGGWIWEDIGNYYGAGARQLDWRENQFDLLLKSDAHIGDPVVLTGTNPSFIDGLHLKDFATTAPEGTGDRTIIYTPLFGNEGALRGTIPVNETKFVVSGSMPHPERQLALTLESRIKNKPIGEIYMNYPGNAESTTSDHIFYTHTSPDLDSITYWFLKRSINLYGEALTKTLGYTLTGNASTDSGVALIQRHWNERGISSYAMNIQDGCGLSPANRVTPKTLVAVMQYARRQAWFPAFYYALPEIDGIKMKSGSIGGVVSYTGYITGKTGQQYTFAFIVNNLFGNPDYIRRKMWNLLDILK
jgi:serine-type D-Ala-D-Ala carboxypeptidase/endopeptidase (penicillin-binding protein 4)